jgi:protein TonB
VKEEKKKETKETKVEPVKEKPAEVKPKETTPLAEYKKEEKKETKTDVKTDGGKSTTSQGDDSAKVGDKGDPEGSLDANALYGKQGGGGGGGLALSMSGWAWADQPKIPELPDNADGRIVFEIECDDNGEIVGITTVERGLSPKAEQILKDEIRKNSLIRTSGGKVPERSKGRVVFLLKTK